MSDFQITQEEAEKLLNEKKYRIDDTKYSFPKTGGSLNIPLKTKTHEEAYTLDVWRSKIELKKTPFRRE